VVEVVEEAFEGAHALADTGGDAPPLLRRDHARDRVDREGTLLTGVVEGDPLVEVAAGQRLRAGPELLQAQPVQRVVQRLVGGSHAAVGREHLVSARAGASAVEQRGGRHVYHSRTTPSPVWRRPPRKRAPCPWPLGSPPLSAPPPAPPPSAAACAIWAGPRPVPSRGSAEVRAADGAAGSTAPGRRRPPSPRTGRGRTRSRTAPPPLRSRSSTRPGRTGDLIRARSYGGGCRSRRISPAARIARCWWSPRRTPPSAAPTAPARCWWRSCSPPATAPSPAPRRWTSTARPGWTSAPAAGIGRAGPPRCGRTGCCAWRRTRCAARAGGWMVPATIGSPRR